MGFTLRAVLNNLPPTGKVAVAELNPAVLEYSLDIQGAGASHTPIRTLLKPWPGGGYVLLTVNLFAFQTALSPVLGRPRHLRLSWMY